MAGAFFVAGAAFFAVPLAAGAFFVVAFVAGALVVGLVARRVAGVVFAAGVFATVLRAAVVDTGAGSGTGVAAASSAETAASSAELAASSAAAAAAAATTVASVATTVASVATACAVVARAVCSVNAARRSAISARSPSRSSARANPVRAAALSISTLIIFTSSSRFARLAVRISSARLLTRSPASAATSSSPVADSSPCAASDALALVARRSPVIRFT